VSELPEPDRNGFLVCPDCGHYLLYNEEEKFFYCQYCGRIFNEALE